MTAWPIVKYTTADPHCRLLRSQEACGPVSTDTGRVLGLRLKASTFQTRMYRIIPFLFKADKNQQPTPNGCSRKGSGIGLEGEEKFFFFFFSIRFNHKKESFLEEDPAGRELSGEGSL